MPTRFFIHPASEKYGLIVASNGIFVWPIRIYYEDTDVSGVVYHANYLRYFERARTEWLRARGFSQERLMQDLDIAFTVVSLQVNYRQPARLDDELLVHLEVIRAGKASLVFSEKIVSQNNNHTVLADGEFRAACVRASDFRPTPMPQQVLEEIKGVRGS